MFTVEGALAQNNPYAGPRPFEIGETLFGREREVAALRYMLTSERIVLLYSPSGAGKSSLINAGLLPQLANRFDIWGPARLNLLPPDGNWNRYVWSTIAALEKSETLPEMTLTEYAAQRPREGNPLILFDQFEEVLRLDPVDLAAKRAFFEQLGEMLRDPGIWALFVLREDYLAPLDAYRRLLPTQFQNRYRIDRLTREMAIKAIEKPVETTSRKYFPGVVETLADNLTKVKIQQPDGSFREEPGVYVEPLQLQVVCYDLWEKLKPNEQTIGLDKVGDIGEALSSYYVNAVERAAGRIENTERLIREWFQNKLITPDGVRNQVRHEAVASGGLDNALIAKLVDSYIVRAEHRGGSLWYELSHDRLIDPISQNNEAWFTAHLSKSQQRALQWDKEGRPESLLFRRDRTGSRTAVGSRPRHQTHRGRTTISRCLPKAATKRVRGEGPGRGDHRHAGFHHRAGNLRPPRTRPRRDQSPARPAGSGSKPLVRGTPASSRVRRFSGPGGLSQGIARQGRNLLRRIHPRRLE